MSELNDLLVAMIKKDYEPEGYEKALMEQYEELLIQKEQMLKDAASYQIAYYREYGEMITAVFELKVECIKKKKTISYCRRRMNRGLEVDVRRMESEVEQEMQGYYSRLKDLIRERERAENAQSVSEFLLLRAKKIYRRLAKVLHPDINPNTMEHTRLRDLWEQITAAYHHTDVERMEELEFLVRMAMEELGEESFEPDMDGLEEKIERVEREINEIVTSEPYTYKNLLLDPDSREGFRDQLQAEHDDYEMYLESLTKTLEEMLRDGGAKVVWKTS